MIMVHKSHLILCCYNCFYKLCEGNEFSCILCKSYNELSNCAKCNLNICKRCVINHKIDQASDGILKKCFGCDPQMLWSQRAQAANVLKIFNSQLDMPNGLLVNEVEREQTVRKYLLKQAKIGQNLKINTVKDNLCIKVIYNSYKLDVVKKLSDFSPNIGDNVEDCSNVFIEICEDILEKTSSALTNFKRIFNLNTNLSPGVSAIMKSLLKSVDDDENMVHHSKLNTSSKKVLINNDEPLNTISLRSNTKNNLKSDVLISSLNNSAAQANFQKENTEKIEKKKELIVVLERLEDSVLSKMIKKQNINQIASSNDIDINNQMDNIEHALDLFGGSSNDEEVSPKISNNNKLKQMNKKKITKESKTPKKINDLLNTLSDDEKKNKRLINLSNINQCKKGIKSNEHSDDSDESFNKTNESPIDVDDNISSINKISTKNMDKINIMEETVQNVDGNDSDIEDDLQDDDNLLQSVKDVFSEVRNAAFGIPQIISDSSSDESDNNCISEVINSCLNACNRRGIDHYQKKSIETHLNISDIEYSESSSEEKETTITTRSKKLIKMPSLSDNSNSSFDINKEKRKFSSSSSSNNLDLSDSNNSDSSSKYFKRTPITRSKSNFCKNVSTNVSVSCSSSNDSSDETISPIVKKRKLLHRLPASDESDDKNSDSSKSSITSFKPKKGRKNIRKLKKNTDLSQLTLNALKEEDSRKKRINDRQKLYNQIFDLPKPTETFKKLILDFDPKTKKELITVHPDIVKFLKPHQVEGIKFLWTSVFESLAEIKNGKGNGSIVAHCMGLGKTLQIIALIHTLFNYPETGIKTVLIITPHSTIENWCNEFMKWLNNIPENNNFSIFNFTESKTYESRNRLIDKWQEQRGVLISSYQMYRTVVNHKTVKKFPNILKGLVDPGPDLVICDEGHLLKNHKSALSKTISNIKTLRRIVLTGTPLQNNLKEYHCMVDFIRPNLLGTIREFQNQFVNPINNGQYSDSTPLDVKLMKKRSHVLHRMLEGIVQRFDYSVLTPFLPPKHEYVIYLKMADRQIELYRHYLNNLRQPGLFFNYNILQKIWTHPKLLALYALRTIHKKEKLRSKDMDEVLIDDDSNNSDTNSNSNETIESDPQPTVIPELIRAKSPELDLHWWKSLISKKEIEAVYPYSKFIMMFSILKECEEIGDKVLIFSQYLDTLDLIQEFLEDAEDLVNDSGGPYGKSWTQGEDFFRIDGSVNVKAREDCCEQFNDVKNSKMRLLLLSTKAFNLGINLVGANRVIIFDVTWNPSLNVQSIFRVFRFGQNKPCYIYRLVSEGTMEQKMYERQISKLSLSFRVVDEHQIDRHFNAKDQDELYEFEPNTSKPESFNLPKDRLMAEVVLKHKDLVMNILEHDSLLQNNEAEELDEHERKAAWEDYEKERDGLNKMQNQLNPNNETVQFVQNDDITLFKNLQTHFPSASLMQLNDIYLQVKQQMMQNK